MFSQLKYISELTYEKDSTWDMEVAMHYSENYPKNWKCLILNFEHYHNTIKKRIKT